MLLPLFFATGGPVLWLDNLGVGIQATSGEAQRLLGGILSLLLVLGLPLVLTLEPVGALDHLAEVPGGQLPLPHVHCGLLHVRFHAELNAIKDCPDVKVRRVSRERPLCSIWKLSGEEGQQFFGRTPALLHLLIEARKLQLAGRVRAPRLPLSARQHLDVLGQLWSDAHICQETLGD